MTLNKDKINSRIINENVHLHEYWNRPNRIQSKELIRIIFNLKKRNVTYKTFFRESIAFFLEKETTQLIILVLGIHDFAFKKKQRVRATPSDEWRCSTRVAKKKESSKSVLTRKRAKRENICLSM